MGANSFNLASIIGTPFQEFVTQQLSLRGLKNRGYDRNLTRTPSEVLFIGNKTAWVRLQSSVSISGSISPNTNANYDYYDLLKDQSTDDPNWWPTDGSWDKTDRALAQQWILQSGTSKLNTTDPNKQQIDLRSGLGYDGAYGLGGIKEMGYRPMPGLNDVQIETKGKYGSLRFATINFKVWNMNQLDVIDALYFRLGFTMLLEWGHTQYFVNNEPDSLETKTYGVSRFFESGIPKEELQNAINKEVFTSSGNYDAMLGVVINFNYTMNQDGGWDCSLKLIGLGSLLESQRINSNYNLPGGVAAYFDQLIIAKIKAERKAAYDAAYAKYLKDLTAANGAFAAEKTSFEKNNPVKSIGDFYKGDPQREANFFSHLRFVPSLALKNAFAPGDEDTTIKPGVSGYNQVLVLLNKASLLSDNASDDSLNRSSIVLVKANNDKTVFLPNVGVSPFSQGFLNPLAAGATVKFDYAGFKSFLIPSSKFEVATQAVALVRPGLTTTDAIYLDEIVMKYYPEDGDANANTFNGLPSENNIVLGAKLALKAIGRGQAIGAATDLVGPTALFLVSQIYSLYWGADLFDTNKSIKLNGFTATAKRKREGRIPFIRQFVTVKDSSISDLELDYDCTIGIGKITSADGTIDLTNWFIDYQDVYKFLGKVAVELNRQTTNTTLLEMKVQDVDTTNKSKVRARLIQDGSIQGDSYLLINATDFSSDYRWKLTDNPGASSPTRADYESVRVYIDMDTEWLNLITQAVTGKEVVEPVQGAGPTAPVLNNTITQADIDQAKKAAGLESALDAMLRIILYSTNLELPKVEDVLVRDITSDTGRMLVAEPNTLFSGIFKDNLDSKGNIDKKQPYTLNSDYIKERLTAADRLTDPVSLGIKGFSTNLMSYQQSGQKQLEAFDICYPNSKDGSVDEAIKMFEGLFTAYRVPYKISNSADTEELSSFSRSVYIKLGYLLFFINNYCMLYDTTKGKGLNGSPQARPLFYIDFNPETNLCFTQPQQLAMDPRVCLVPATLSQEQYNKIFTTVKPEKLSEVFPVKDKKTGKDSANLTLWNPKKDDGVSSFISLDSKKRTLQNYRLDDSAYTGRHMNILLNVQYLLDQLRSATQTDGHGAVYLKGFLDSVLRDVNRSLGDINAFRVSYCDPANTVTIVDDQFVKPAGSCRNDENVIKDANFVTDLNSNISLYRRLILPIFKDTSVVRDLQFETNITTKMSAMIAIGATAGSGSAQGVDGSGFRSLSLGMTDRIITQRQEVQSTAINPDDEGDNNNVLARKFNSHVKAVYNYKAINTQTGFGIEIDNVSAAINYLIINSANVKAGNPYTNANPVIPLNVSFTTDGISGIMMGNTFLLPDRILPISVRSNANIGKFGFMVTKLNHAIAGNQWTTEIGGQMVRLKDIQYDQKDNGSMAFNYASPLYLGSPLSGDTNGNLAVDDGFLFRYLTQFGPVTVDNLYLISIGQRTQFSSGMIDDYIIDNWPGGSVASDGTKASDIALLYLDPANHVRIANAFLDVWRPHLARKLNSALSVLNSPGVSTDGVPYATIKDTLINAQSLEEGWTWELVGALGNAENGLSNTTYESVVYKTMFQLNIAYYSDILNQLTKVDKGGGRVAYEPFDKLAKLFVERKVREWKAFKDRVNYTGP